MLPFDRGAIDEPALEPRKAGNRIRPGVQPMPGEVQRIEFGRRNRGGIDPELRQYGFEVFSVQNIEPGERTAARTDLLHRRLNSAAAMRRRKRPDRPPGAYRAKKAADSRATPLRQSTTVPKTSKTSA